MKRSLVTGSTRCSPPELGWVTHMKTHSSPDTHRGPHPPDTGYTPGVSEPCRAHTRTPKKRRRFSGEAIFQPGVGVLGTAVAYRSASVKTRHAEEALPFTAVNIKAQQPDAP